MMADAAAVLALPPSDAQERRDLRAEVVERKLMGGRHVLGQEPLEACAHKHRLVELSARQPDLHRSVHLRQKVYCERPQCSQILL